MESQNSGILTSCDVSDQLLMNNSNVGKNMKNNGIEEEFFLVPEETSELQIIEREDDEVDKLSQMCRTCGTVNDHLIPIFKEDGLEHNFSSKIEKHLPMKVCETDILPLQLCYQCAATLLAFDELAESVLTVQSRLLRLQEQAEQRRPVIFQETAKAAENTQFQQKESEEEQPIQVEINENPKTERSKRRDALLMIETNSKRSSPKFEYYMKKCASIIRVTDKKKLKISPQKKIIETKKNSKTQNSLRKKSPNNLNNTNFQITKNSINSKNDEILNDNKLKNNEIFTQVSLEKSIIKKEKLSTINEKSFECDKCDKKYKLNDNLKNHQRTHSNEKTYTCHICGKQFQLRGSLYYHLRHVHGGVKNHSCDICGRCFAMKTTLEDHRHIHTGERPYVCDTCGKTFKSKASLYIHRKSHTNDYPHKCCYCKRGFRWKQQMMDHLTTHTGVKNHVCDICSKAFGVKKELTRHIKIHSEEKPYSCLQCGLNFGQKRYLKNHERTKHKNNDDGSSVK